MRVICKRTLDNFNMFLLPLFFLVRIVLLSVSKVSAFDDSAIAKARHFLVHLWPILPKCSAHAEMSRAEIFGQGRSQISFG